MKRKIYFLFLILFLPISLLKAAIFINELMPRNLSFLVNEDYNFVGWAELYNSGSQSVDISAYYFSDDEADLLKWKIKTDNRMLAAGAFAIIYFDELNKENHASFKLKPEGGVLTLVDRNGNVLDRLSYPASQRNISYGRKTDGITGVSNIGFLLEPTPGRSNNTTTITRDKTSIPTFDLPAGYYTTTQQVAISSRSSGAKIYYTLDGSEPQAGVSSLYSSPITISKNTPLRAIAVVDGTLPSEIATASYFINSWSNALPVVSLVTDSEFLFGDELGMLVVGTNGLEVPHYCVNDVHGFFANYWRDWDRPCNFEFFDKNKQQQLNQEVKVGGFGNCSRAKFIKSIKVNPTKEYGGEDGNRLNYALFNEKPNLKWKSIVLRNSGNDSGHSFLRDGFMQTLLVGQLDIDHQAYEPVVVFINGEYYGMLNARERTNQDFVYSNYGLDEDQFYLVEGAWGDGTIPDYQDLISLSYAGNLNTSSVYNQLESAIDIDEFLNHFMSQFYFGNTDWPGWNIKAWKPKENGKWRWILYDTDFGFSLYDNNVALNPFERVDGNTVSDVADYHRFILFIKNNDKLKKRFLTKNIVHLATTFEENRVIHILDSIKNHVAPDALVFEKYMKENDAMEAWSWWGRSWSDVIDVTMKTFARNRPAYMFEHLKGYFNLGNAANIRIHSNLANARFILNDEKIPVVPDFNSKYYAGLDLQITPVAPQGYRFKEWEITKESEQNPIIDSRSIYQGVFGEEAVDFKAVFEEDPDWQEPFLPQIYLNEICITNSQYVDEYFESGDWIELYNAGETAVNIGGMYVSDTKNNLRKFQIPGGSPEKTTIPSKGYLILWADSQPEKGVLHTNFSLSASEVETVSLSVVKEGELYVVDSISYQLHVKGETFARFSNDYWDGEWKITSRPTFASQNIYILSTTDVTTIFLDGSMARIYPNPVSETLWFSLPEAQSVEVTIVDLMGRHIVTKSVSDGEGIDVSSLPNGMYLAVISNSQTKQTVKFIKK